MQTIRDKYTLADDISVMNVAKFPDIIKTEEKEEDEDEMWAMFKESLEIALNKLVDMRQQEGKKLEEDTLRRCDILSGYINEIERLSDTVVADYRDKLNTRIKELLENPNEIDENRMAQEVAI